MPHCRSPGLPSSYSIQYPRPSPQAYPAMDKSLGGYGSDVKTRIMLQVQQEAAMQSARTLVEVRADISQSTVVGRSTKRCCRNSTSTALNAASPSPAPHCPKARRAALQHAWKSTWAHGTPSRNNTSRGYRKSRKALRRAYRRVTCWDGIAMGGSFPG